MMQKYLTVLQQTNIRIVEVFTSGGYKKEDEKHSWFSEILRFDKEAEEWVITGNMSNKNSDFALSALPLKDIEQYCI